MDTTKTYTVTVEYTLSTNGNMEYKVDAIDLERPMKPSQLARRLQAGWQAVRQEAVEILDLVVVRIVETTQVTHVTEDRYHVHYSA